MRRVAVRGVPAFVTVGRLLGDGAWVEEGGAWCAELTTAAAADLSARLRGVALAGQPIDVVVSPKLPRTVVRAARTDDARRRRASTVGFERPAVRLDDEGRWSLTPERLALAFAETVRGCSVVDAACGAGGDAIALARAGCRVTAIELDPRRLALARHNAGVYGVADRITWVCGDALREVPARSADVLYLDPPWGEDYRRPDVKLPLLELVDDPRVHAGYGRVFAKVPAAFDPAGVQAQAVFGEAEGDRQRVKFLRLCWAFAAR
jgi:SAM-dependent methyltransferase